MGLLTRKTIAEALGPLKKMQADLKAIIDRNSVDNEVAQAKLDNLADQIVANEAESKEARIAAKNLEAFVTVDMTGSNGQ